MAKAKMKIDMKQINKFRFWIGLGVLAVLLLVLSYFQLTAIGGEKEQKAYAEKLKAVKGLNDFKNDKFLPAWNAREEKLKTQRDEIWNKAWLPQKDMQTWFKRDEIWEKKYDTKSGKLVWSKIDPNIPEKLSMNANNEGNWRPSEPIDGTTLDIYKDTLYLSQFHNFEKELVDARFPVEFNNGFDSLMAPITWKRGSTPTAEEVWLAQESFWVKRELVRDILRAIQSIGMMTPDTIAKDEVTPPEVKARKRFYNSIWEVDLMFESQEREKFISPRSKIMNVHQDQRILPLDNPVAGSTTEFVLRQGTTVVPLRAQGEPLGFGQVREFLKDKIVLPFSFDITKDFTLEQIFTSKNTPIKMIYALEIARASHRMANLKLVSRSPNVLKKDTGGADAPGEGGAGPGSPPGGMPGSPPGGMPGSIPGAPPGGMPSGGMMGGRGLGSANVAKDPTLINGIDRAIYIHATDQCRHLPFAMSLILDQTIMNEVLTSLANSKLRIQITQFHYQHLNGYKSSNLIAGAAGPTDASADNSGGPTGFRPPVAGPGGPGGFRPPPGSGGGSESGGMRPPGPGGMGSFRPGVPGSGGTTDGSGDINIVELNLYGVASLFEKPGAPPVAPAEGAK
jgi:hypothetical protein